MRSSRASLAAALIVWSGMYFGLLTVMLSFTGTAVLGEESAVGSDVRGTLSQMLILGMLYVLFGVAVARYRTSRPLRVFLLCGPALVALAFSFELARFIANPIAEPELRMHGYALRTMMAVVPCVLAVWVWRFVTRQGGAGAT